MANEQWYRLRLVSDIRYQAKEPLSTPEVAAAAINAGRAVRLLALEGVKEVTVSFAQADRHETAHHHDATAGRCRRCSAHAADDLGHG